MKPKRNHPERALQKAAAQFLSKALPKDAWFSSIPGGEGRATRTPGYAAGCPDIIVLVGGKFIGFELKAKYRKLSAVQFAGQVKIIKAGGQCLTAYSVKDLQDELLCCGVKLRAKVSA